MTSGLAGAGGSFALGTSISFFGGASDTGGWVGVRRKMPHDDNVIAVTKKSKSATDGEATKALFPLNRSRRFGRNVIHDTVDTFYFIDDFVRNFCQKRMRQR